MGLTNTHFATPSGLDADSHYTTSYELSIITKHALNNAEFAKVVATNSIVLTYGGTDHYLSNHNRLLSAVDGVIGVKTGFTKASGRCLVSAARRDGLTLIAVTLNDPNDWRDHTALYDWGFSQYVAFSPAFPAFILPVVGGTQASVTLKPADSIHLTLPATHGEITCRIEAPRFLYAGLAAGQAVGRVTWEMDGRLIAQSPLITTTEVANEITPLSLWERIKKLFGK